MSGHNDMLYKYYRNCSGIRMQRLWRFGCKWCNHWLMSIQETKWMPHVKRESDAVQSYISSGKSHVNSSLLQRWHDKCHWDIKAVVSTLVSLQWWHDPIVGHITIFFVLVYSAHTTIPSINVNSYISNLSIQLDLCPFSCLNVNPRLPPIRPYSSQHKYIVIHTHS